MWMLCQEAKDLQAEYVERVTPKHVQAKAAETRKLVEQAYREQGVPVPWES